MTGIGEDNIVKLDRSLLNGIGDPVRTAFDGANATHDNGRRRRPCFDNRRQDSENMQFSIRALLALTFLAVLVMLLWRTRQEAIRDEQRLAKLQNEIKSLELEVRLDQPDLHQAILHAGDEFASLRAMRELALQQFDRLRQKYSTMEPPGAGQLSIRGVPTLRAGTGQPAVIFGIWVPEERPVWLKFGVHLADGSIQSLRDSDRDDDLLRDSPFDASGPFEIRLPAGHQTLKLATGPVQDDTLPVVVSLGDEVLGRFVFNSPDVQGTNEIYISARSQLDFAPDRRLPRLLTSRMRLRDPTSGERPDTTYACSLWLSDHSSNFERFPGE